MSIVVLFALVSQVLVAADSPSAPEYDISMKEAWISMPDGVRLAANLHMPKGAVENKAFPVLLKHLPYRKTEARADGPIMVHFPPIGMHVIMQAPDRPWGDPSYPVQSD